MAVRVLFVDGIERQPPAVVRPAGMQVATRRDRIGGIGPERADVVALLFCEVIEEQPPRTVRRAVRIGVRHHPFFVWRRDAMAVSGEHVLRDDFDPVRLVPIAVVLPVALIRPVAVDAFETVGVVDDLRLVDPRVMAAHVLQIQWPDVRAVAVRGERMGDVAADVVVPYTPAMEERKAFARRAEQQMVEPRGRSGPMK